MLTSEVDSEIRNVIGLIRQTPPFVASGQGRGGRGRFSPYWNWVLRCDDEWAARPTHHNASNRTDPGTPPRLVWSANDQDRG